MAALRLAPIQPDTVITLVGAAVALLAVVWVYRQASAVGEGITDAWNTAKDRVDAAADAGIEAAAPTVRTLWNLTPTGAAANAGNQIIGAIETGAYAIGDVLGLPRTTPTACQLAKQSGDVLGASFNCPAGEFAAWIADGMPRQ